MQSYSSAIASLPADSKGSDSESFSDYLTMKVIAGKRVQQFGNVYGANANPLGFPKELVRNLGIRVDPIRLAELDSITEVLACNKQEFMLELLVGGIEQAKAAFDQAGLRRLFDEALDRNITAAGLTLDSSPDGNWALRYKGEPITNRDAAKHEKAARAMTDIVEQDLPRPE